MSRSAGVTPLWMLATGAAASAATAMLCAFPGSPIAHWALIGFGSTAVVLATVGRTPRSALLFLVAGLALGGGRGLQVRSDRLQIEPYMQDTSRVSLRSRLTISDGWSATRWGYRSKALVRAAKLRDQELPITSPCTVEVRGRRGSRDLPQPGTTIEALVELRGSSSRPLLVVASPLLFETVDPPRGIARLRDHLAGALLRAAGTDVDRIRAAELAAALALGRRDAIPDLRRQGWRRSGLAHVLAVSGLHVGLVGGAVWLAALAFGLRPTSARLAVLVALPAYALLTGASPSAVRAAAMGMIYLAARFLGRSLVPIAAVLLAGLAMLLADPALVTDVGFQLTVVVTAALVRWVPRLTEVLPAPRWLAAAIAVPAVAQAAALPIIAWHFRTVVPGGIFTNLVVIPFLGPVLLIAIATAMVAPIWSAAASGLLEILHIGQSGLWACGAIARRTMVLSPPVPAALTATLVIIGWLALRPTRIARLGAGLWLASIVITASWWALRPEPAASRVTLLPVADGSAVVLSHSDDHHMLFDAGRYRNEAAELLAEHGIRRLAVVLASHTDEDHIGGLVRVLETVKVEELVLPAWMSRSSTVVPLLRTARRRGTSVRLAARGTALPSRDVLVEILWPPAMSPPTNENDRSVVARVVTPAGRVLLTADTGRSVERSLSRISTLQSEVLLVPHHGSGTSTSSALLDACDPQVALVPAGMRNPHGHPKQEVLQRLQRHGIPFRVPVRDGWCGAVLVDGVWRPFP